jgi:hypothetical protein
MQDSKNRAVAREVQKFVGVPTGVQRSSFSLAVADDAGDDQMRIVEGRAISVEQGIPRPDAISDRARSAKGSLSTGRVVLHRMVDEWKECAAVYPSASSES